MIELKRGAVCAAYVGLLACSTAKNNAMNAATGEVAGAGASGMPALGGAGTGTMTTSSAGASGSATMTANPGASGRAATAGSSGNSGNASVAGSGGMTAGAGTGAAGQSSAGAGGAAGAAGMPAATKPPFMPTGEVIPNTGMGYTWVSFPDSHCRDGSPAGFSISFTSSDKLAIYLEGGGACFDASTCFANPASVPSQTAGSDGIFDRTNAANPIKDWNMVYVPYCTGDVHMGANPMGQVDGVSGIQQFVGRTNLQAFLNRLVPTFAKATQVLLTGASAGGFGAAASGEFVQWAFGSIPVTMIDDSGPTMSSMFLPKCMSQINRKVWNLDESILKDCGDDCPDKDDYQVDYLKHVAKVNGSRMAGLIESSQDDTIRTFYGIGTDGGKNDCMGDLFSGMAMDAAQFTAGLLDLRMTVQSVYPNYGTYFPNSTQHTWIAGASFYTQSTGGVKMVDWFNDILTGTKAAQIGP